MGVALIDIPKEYKTEMGLGDKIGAFASQVYLDSPAAKAGIQAGDFITSLNGKPVLTVNQLVREVGDLRVNAKAAFTVIRNGKEVSVSVTIEARKDDSSRSNAQLWPGFIALPLTDARRKELKLDESVKGVVVSDVEQRSPAAAMRLAKGEVITAVNDKKVTNLREFYDALNISNKTEVWFDVRDEDNHAVSTNRYKLK
jgi:S1-C subfamily serine protease